MNDNEKEQVYRAGVARLAGQYLEAVTDGKMTSAALMVSWFQEDFGLPGWADLCALMVHAAVTTCPNDLCGMDGRIDAARLVADRLPLAERQQRITEHLERVREVDGMDLVSVPTERVDRVLAAAGRARDLVQQAAAAGPGLAEIRAVLAAELDDGLAAPVLMYAVLACQNAGVSPADLTANAAAGAGPASEGT